MAKRNLMETVSFRLNRERFEDDRVWQFLSDSKNLEGLTKSGFIKSLLFEFMESNSVGKHNEAMMELFEKQFWSLFMESVEKKLMDMMKAQQEELIKEVKLASNQAVREALEPFLAGLTYGTMIQNPRSIIPKENAQEVELQQSGGTNTYNSKEKEDIKDKFPEEAMDFLNQLGG